MPATARYPAHFSQKTTTKAKHRVWKKTVLTVLGCQFLFELLRDNSVMIWKSSVCLLLFKQERVAEITLEIILCYDIKFQKTLLSVCRPVIIFNNRHCIDGCVVLFCTLR